MSPRYLVGPVSPARARDWHHAHSRGECLCFGPAAGEGIDLHLYPSVTWQELLAALPARWQPDFVVLDLAYACVPTCLWNAPVPLVALAIDAQLQWHAFRHALPLCQLVFADGPTAAFLTRHGITQTRPAHLFGLQGEFTQPWSVPEPARDIDIAFVGNLNPAVQPERLPWLARLARLADRYRVVVAEGIHGPAYRALLRRCRIVFNRTIKGEWNLRVGEACVSGALLFVEAENTEMPPLWRHGENCIFYTKDDLESLLEYYLEHENERQAIARSGKLLAQEHTFQASWAAMLGQIEAEWPDLQRRLADRQEPAHQELLRLRCWQVLSAATGTDPSLVEDLVEASAQSAWAGVMLGVLLASRAGRDAMGLRRATDPLRQALARTPDDPVAGLAMVEILDRLGQQDLARQGALRLLDRLAADPDLDLGIPPLARGFDFLRIAWEQAAWKSVDAQQERQAKTSLLRWRLHALLATWTGELHHYHEAALAWPDLPGARAALGCALARQGKTTLAVPHLRFATQADPFDAGAARACYQALLDANVASEAQNLARGRALLHRAAPARVPLEEWFHQGTPAQPDQPTGQLRIRWEGAFLIEHSLALVNRRLSLTLSRLGHVLTLVEVPSPGPTLPAGRERDAVLTLRNSRAPAAEEVCIRHHWPPSWQAPVRGHWVLMQPWEYGAIPRAWVQPLCELVDEVWVPTQAVREGFLRSGIPEDLVHVVPNGVDPDLFRPEGDPLRLPTSKTFKLLFVGGTIHRKGVDLLLQAYRQAFDPGDDVCLVLKDMGSTSFYQGQTAGEDIRAFRDNPGNPEVLYLEDSLTEEQMAALYRECQVLVHPYRGEGFGLPIAEAMSCGLPVVVTGAGAAMDFVDEQVGWLIPSREVTFADGKLGEFELAGPGLLAEPDVAALAGILREVHQAPSQRRQRGMAGRQRVLDRLTWHHAAAQAERRLLALRKRPVRRGMTNHSALVRGQRLFLHDPTQDRVLSGHLASGMPYEPYLTDRMLEILKPGDRVLDIGAGLGMHALLFSEKVGPTGKVWSFEPDPDNFALVQRSLTASGRQNVRACNVAAGKVTGKMLLHRCADNRGDHRVFDSADGRPTVEIESVRLDDFLAHEEAAPLTLIKMDVQGAEGLVLDGMRGLLAASPGVVLALEFWPWGLRLAGSDPGAVLRQLEQMGFALHEVREDRRNTIWTRPDELLARLPERENAFTNLLCLPLKEPLSADGDDANAPLVALCVIVKNEEANIAACLESARDLVDEVVVVDTGSTDLTKEIALSLGAKVFDFPWVDSFSAARNACLENATARWIFWLDADDRLDSTNREKLRDVLRNLPAGNLAYSMKCRCLPDPHTGAVTVVDHIRLFRRDPRIRWRYRIHEQILGAVRESGGEVEFADVAIDHTGYVDPALRARKLQRDLRLLEMEYAEQPGDPFTLFNLGATYAELGRTAEALPLLENSLSRSHPRDSIVRKLHALIATGHRKLGKVEQALTACLRGLGDCPGDAELSLLEGSLRAETGDLHGARAALVRLLGGENGQGFASVVDGLRTYRARHQLALVCRQLNERAEAEGLWRHALVECPGWPPALAGLANLLLTAGREQDAEPLLTQLAQVPGGPLEVALVRGEALLARSDWPAARSFLESELARQPGCVPLLGQYSFALLQEDRDRTAAQRILLEILALDPDNQTARSNLDVLRRRNEAMGKTEVSS